MSRSSQFELSGVYEASEVQKHKARPAKTLPLSIRVTSEEKERLQEMAGDLPTSAYIRQRLFGSGLSKRPQRYQKKQDQPSIDVQQIAQLLGMFGQSEAVRAILALSLAVQMRGLDVTPEVEGQIGRACEDIQEIKTTLVMALGIKPQGLHVSSHAKATED